DAVKEYGFPDPVARKTHYSGYLKRSVAVTPRTDATPHVLVTTGGGGDGSRMIETYLQGMSELAAAAAPRTTVVLGPEMPAVRRPRVLRHGGAGSARAGRADGQGSSGAQLATTEPCSPGCRSRWAATDPPTRAGSTRHVCESVVRDGGLAVVVSGFPRRSETF